ncbi:hypothetical protein [Desulfospira joergensenii]|uniref:hypothetical protein n=1 Tax=Desulfospira joergensenii TaxID=53329 RepID=UPI0003B31D71|nr:hypothetical protein [Desulfospira joergensenii]
MKISSISAPAPFLSYAATSQTEKDSTLPGKNDVVTLSDEGKKMQAQASANSSSLMSTLDNFMDGAGKDGVITLDEIRAFGEKYLKLSGDILAETLEQLGIPADQSMTIHTDEEGRVRVESDLPARDNEKLEAALNRHPEFQQAFTKASSSQSLLDAAEKHLEFAQAYAQDPKAAVARYGIGSPLSGDYVLEYAQGQTSLVLQNSFSLTG